MTNNTATQDNFDFGTSAHMLHRKDSPDTSVQAAYQLDSTKLEKIVYDTIKSFESGCIADDVLAKLPEYRYSSITARFAALDRKGFIYRDGDKRKGDSGRGQLVMRVTGGSDD